MKHFFITLIAVLCGGFLLFFIPFVVLVGIAAASAGSSASQQTSAGTVLSLDLSHAIDDHAVSSPSAIFRATLHGDETSVGLDELTAALKNAADDDNIVALLIRGQVAATDYASLSELRSAIADFKANSHKPVVFFDNSASTGVLFVASVADSIFIVPQGSTMLNGVALQKVYFARMAEKLGIGFDVIKHGKYKSAVEPYFRNSISPEDLEQSQRLVDVLWSQIRDSIAVARGIDPDVVDAFVDNLQYVSGAAAQSAGIISRLAYHDEVLASIAAMANLEGPDDIVNLDIADYASHNVSSEATDRSVAVVFAQGEIYDGASSSDLQNIYGDNLAETIRTVAADSSISAVVLRVNSPGGSALASDVIWHEVVRLRQVKPVVVSMGGYAASGGYYISCAANHIVAQPTTLTGSIGVFGTVPNVQKAAETVGVTVQQVSSNRNQPLLGFQALNPSQFQAVSASVDNTYATFVSRVAQGRNMTTEHVDSIAQGRVWIGQDALQQGLVDQLGGLDDAIEVAAELAAIDDYSVVAYPKADDSFFGIFARSLNVKASLGHAFLGKDYESLARLKEQCQDPKVNIFTICDFRVK